MLNTHLKLSNQWLLVGKTDSVYFRGKRLVFINCPNYFSRNVRKGGGGAWFARLITYFLLDITRPGYLSYTE